MKQIFCLSVIFIFLTNVLFAENSEIKSMTFLEIPPNPRVASLGESFTALANDVSAVYWNPAGLYLLPNAEIGINYNSYFEDMSYFNLQLVTKFRFGTLGFNLSTFNYGDIESYVDNNFAGMINSSDLLLIAAYSVPVMAHLYLGAGIKYALEKLTGTYSGAGVASDIGLLYTSPFSIKSLRLGLMTQNIGFGPKFDQYRHTMPLNIKLGAAYALKLKRAIVQITDINFMLDIVRSSDAHFGIRYGAELWFNQITSGMDIALRLGIKYPSELDFFTSMSFGLGLRLSKLELNYALINFGDLGLTHRFGFNYKFGKIKN